VLAALGQFLSRQGGVPMLARSLGEAQAILGAQGLPDIVISDYRLGAGFDGVSAIATLRKELALDAPGVILTGDTAPEVLRAVSDAGLPIVNKPVRPESLLQTICAELHGAAQRRGLPRFIPRQG
jgi:CheY-like chemotaxis protein